MTDRDERFCPRCGVSTDLHDGTGDEIEEWECETADTKARLIDGFFGAFVR